MLTIIFSSIMVTILSLVVAFLFWRLKDIKLYTITIYLFILIFTIVLFAIAKEMELKKDVIQKKWLFPLSFGLFQFVQVFVKLPLFKLSKKIKSRKLIILFTFFAVFIGADIVLISNFAWWSIPIGFVMLGVFASTFGIQNQYVLESWNTKQMFITIAIVATIPILSKFIVEGSTEIIKYANLKFNSLEDILVWIMIIGAVVSIIFIGFHEEKDKMILLDKMMKHNTEVHSKKILAFKLKDVLMASVTVVLVSLAFQMINKFSIEQVNLNLLPMIINATTIFIALFTSFVIIRIFNSHLVVLFSHMILLSSMIIGVAYIFMGISGYMWLIFIFLSIIGISLFQTTMLGTMLWFDCKNHLLVLGIWLTLRSFSRGVGIVIGDLLQAYNMIHVFKYLFIISLVLIVISTIYSMHMNSKFKCLFSSIDINEYKWFKKNKNLIWKSFRK